MNALSHVLQERCIFIQATLNSKTLDFATHYLVVKLDYAGGFPKLCSIR